MGRLGDTSFYEILEVSHSATTEEIEASYQRLVGVMAPDSLAMYAMLDEDESSRMRAQVDEAYRTLTDPERRAEYDRNQKSESAYPSVMVPEPSGRANLSVAVDRPERPIERQAERQREPEPAAAVERFRDVEPPVARSAVEKTAPPPPMESEESEGATLLPAVPPRVKIPAPVPAPSRRGRLLQPRLGIEVTSDTEFSGGLLRRLRESAEANLDAVSEITKISKRYLHALEENDFDTLPAAVYVRGFVSEYARALGLDPKLVSNSYMNLYKRYRGEGS